MSRSRDKRRTRTIHRPTDAKPAEPPAAIVREAARVERLAYTRAQAAEALGVSRSTFDRRVLPLIETIEMPWGTRLIPADELERLLTNRRRAALRQAPPQAHRGRQASVPADVVRRIRVEHAAGRSLGEIARQLAADQVPTVQTGARWWPSTVRAVLLRSFRLDPAREPR
jgi:Recombinase